MKRLVAWVLILLMLPVIVANANSPYYSVGKEDPWYPYVSGYMVNVDKDTDTLTLIFVGKLSRNNTTLVQNFLLSVVVRYAPVFTTLRFMYSDTDYYNVILLSDGENIIYQVYGTEGELMDEVYLIKNGQIVM